MPRIELSWDDWRAVIATLRTSGLRDHAEHADRLEQQLDQHPPDEPLVGLNLTDGTYLRSFNWARWRLLPRRRSGHGEVMHQGAVIIAGVWCT